MLRNKSIIAAKLETTPGTAETLSAADAGFIAHDLEFNPEAEQHERRSPGTASRLAETIGGRTATATLAIELHGLGALGVPAWAGTFLPACGLVDTASTFKPKTAEPSASAGFPKTITLAKYTDGIIKRLSGGMVESAKFMFAQGQKGRLEMTIKGKYEEILDGALITPSLPSVLPPRVANMTLTLGGGSLRVPSVDIEIANVINLRPDISAAGGESGYYCATITDRRITASIAPEAALVANRDDYNNWLAGTLQSFNLVLGGDANNIITLNMPKAQILAPKDGDREGISTTEMQLLATRNAADDDEFTIAFS